MPQPTNTQYTNVMVGIREDLADAVYKVEVTEIPFQTNIGKAKASSRYHEWQQVALRAANPANAAIEGDTTAATAPKQRTRTGNRVQIFKETGSVSGTAQAVDVAGVADELDEQKLLKGLEVRRDIEANFLQNSVASSGSDTVGGTNAGMESWVRTNVSRGTGGANPTLSNTTSGQPNAAPTDGTLRAFTQAQLDAVMETAFANGAKPTMLFLPPNLKTKFSAFTGIALNRVDNSGDKQVTIVGGADIYLSNFGKLTVVATPFMRNRTALGIDPKMVKKATLRAMFSENLAKTGDSTPFHIIEESTLEVCNEKAHFVIADLQ